jgi:hypothetical protein
MDIFEIVPPIFGRVACPFLPHKRTSTSTVGMSAKGHYETFPVLRASVQTGHLRPHAPRQTASLFDQLVGAREYGWRNVEAECLGGL